MGSTFLRILQSRLALGILLLSCGAMPAGAQEPPPGFLIERIVVEGLERDAARQIVLSESLLHAGRSYSEPELREAIYRVKRLPFVVDADMALRKGSERGAYELVVSVEAAKPIAYSIDAGFTVADPDDIPLGAKNVTYGHTTTLSARKFVGAHGLLFGSAQAYDEPLGTGVVQLGYTHYGLFRRGGFASVAVSTAVGEDRTGSAGDNFQGSLQVGVPLAGNHALRLGYARTHLVSDFGGNQATTFRLDGYEARLDWIYDSTDDPLFATEGLHVDTETAYLHQRQSVRPTVPDFASSEDGWLTVGSHARKYWRVTPRQTVALDGSAYRSQGVFVRNLGIGTSELNGHTDWLSLAAIHAVGLWSEEQRRRLGDLRLESGIGVEHFRASRTSSFGDYESTILRAHATLLFRNRWGLVKLSAVYRNDLETYR